MQVYRAATVDGLSPEARDASKVGEARFELATSASQTPRATKLRHSPSVSIVYRLWIQRVRSVKKYLPESPKA